MNSAIHTLRQLDRRLRQAAAMERLLQQIYHWDHMDTAADGAYWRHEIEGVIAWSAERDNASIRERARTRALLESQGLPPSATKTGSAGP